MQDAETVLNVLRDRGHGVIAGEPRAGKLARGVRTGGRWKRTRLRRAPRQRPTGVRGIKAIYWCLPRPARRTCPGRCRTTIGEMTPSPARAELPTS
jgi:hypothetical protein